MNLKPNVYETELLELPERIIDNPNWDDVAKAAFRCGFASIHPDDNSPSFHRPDLSGLHAFTKLLLEMDK